jgi:hypothetical protein
MTSPPLRLRLCWTPPGGSSTEHSVAFRNAFFSLRILALIGPPNPAGFLRREERHGRLLRLKKRS